MITLELPSLVLLGVAITSLVVALVKYPRTKQPLYRIDKVSFHDGAVVFYPMRRVPFGQWKIFELEKGIRGYRNFDEAKAAIEDYLANDRGLEISRTETVEEYGA
jgi:hypothetical protein